MLLAVGTEASTGQATCKCLGTKEKFICSSTVSTPCITVVDCSSYSWKNAQGKCVNATATSLKFSLYPYDYGDSCKIHEEPGSMDCYIANKTVPTKKTKTDQKGWCYSPWCYIDECACDAGDAEYSYWFKPVKIPYSYVMCGGSDSFTAAQAEATGKAKGDGCPATSEDASNAQMVAKTLVTPIVLLAMWLLQ